MARGVKKQANRSIVKSINKTIRISPVDAEIINKVMELRRCTFSSLVMDLILQESIRNESDSNFT
jgi:hypothetical protein